MSDYIRVCNEALSLNKDRFPFKQILGAARKSEKGRPVEVKVLDGGPGDVYVFKLRGDGIFFEPHESCENCDCVRTWKTDIPYLKAIAENPEIYIQNPAKINWEWMYGA